MSVDDPFAEFVAPPDPDTIAPPAGPVIVTLEPWEYVHASTVGAGRYAANFRKQDSSYYKKELMEDDRTAQQAAAIAELAVAKHVNQYWSGSVWDASAHSRYRAGADVGHDIEVRRVRKGATAAVRKKQLGQGLILWVAYPIPPEFRQVEVWGWLPYDQAWEIGQPSNYSPEDTRVVHRSLLNSPHVF